MDIRAGVSNIDGGNMYTYYTPQTEWILSVLIHQDGEKHFPFD